MRLDELLNTKKVSKKAYSICKYCDFKSVKDLRRFYAQYKTFINIRNCNEKLNDELIAICKNSEYIDEPVAPVAKNSADEIKKTTVSKEDRDNLILRMAVSKLTSVQRELINKFIVITTNNLSTRCRNLTVSYLADNLTIEHLVNTNFLFSSLEDLAIIGFTSSTVSEVDTYTSNIKLCLREVFKNDDNDVCLFKLNNERLIQSLFPNTDIPKRVIASKSIFSYVDYLLNEDALFNSTHTSVFKKSYKLYQHQKSLNLKETADIVNLRYAQFTSARTRCSKELYGRLAFIQLFNDNICEKYGIDVDSNIISIDEQTVALINNTNNTNFSTEFITYILYVYLHDKFSLLGNIDNVLRIRYNNSKSFTLDNFYLIKKRVANGFNFTAFVDDINTRLHNNQEIAYPLNFKSYLTQFYLTQESLDEIPAIAEHIINRDLGLYLHENDQLEFKISDLNSVPKYVYKADENLGKPSSLEETCQKTIEENTNYISNRTALNKSEVNKDGVDSVQGVTDLGTIKEEKAPKTKVGTTGDLAEVYLKQNKKPMHLSMVFKYILKYRSVTTCENVKINLKKDKQKRFVFYEGSLVGLSSKTNTYKKFNLSIEKSSSQIRWEKNHANMHHFIEIEKRLPRLDGSTKEANLYHWFKIQQSALENGNLEAGNAILIKQLENKYLLISSPPKKQLSITYDNLIAFVNTNHRLPLATLKGEVALYNFFNEQKNLFLLDKQDAVERELFVEVLRIEYRVRLKK